MCMWGVCVCVCNVFIYISAVGFQFSQKFRMGLWYMF